MIRGVLKSGIICLCLTLTACANSYKTLPEEYKGKVTNVDVPYYHNPELIFPSGSPGAYNSSGGLVGLLAVTLVTSAMEASDAINRREQAELLNPMLDSYDFNKNVKIPTKAIVENSKFFHVNSFVEVDGQKDYRKILSDKTVSYTMPIRYDYVVNGSVLTGRMAFGLYKKDDPKNPVFSNLLTAKYMIPGAGINDGDPVGEWHDNNGKLLKEAITQTSRKLNATFAKCLNDPFAKKDCSKEELK